ncbi:phage holin family protein [Riemerella anatipestifer]|uniref:Phage holin family protein n=1 Tax=Riemerella anatipestifer TaxID=34085 RepID=A0AAP6LK36_RIEAN|nr:phage holin family protein [Riemerella anatipestifer]MCD5969473.1 phage holin family protein [Riemerella anatipestifer]MCO7354116.1 phage holin family protein [Riemerella anatipestifer]MCU7540211.1 phage holin family protein [Riemerella anatipestifer]MCU7570001.1 phage holin family protein [Riemerella anatipestifer]MCU7597507.1 phage holin family protein [Riemerella anatipestifer]
MINLLKNYAQKRLDLIKLEATEKMSIKAGNIAFLVILGIFFLFLFIFLNTGLAILLGYYMQNIAYGFLIVAGVYLLLIIFLLLFKNSVKEGIANVIIKSINK